MNKIEELENKIEDLKKELEELKKSEKVNKRWRARENKLYWYLNGDLIPHWSNDFRDNFDDIKNKIHNYFISLEEAEKVAEKIKIYIELKDLAEELNEGVEIDWDNSRQPKHCFWKNCDSDNLYSETVYSGKHIGQIYCLNSNFLEIAKKRIGEERLLKLFE